MTRIYRASRYLLTAIFAGGLFLLINATQLAQSNKLPPPKSHVSDLAGVVDAQTRTRLDGVLERLKEKSNIDLYVAVVDTTDGIDVSDYSQRLAREWNIGAKTSRSKSLLLVISAASKSSFTQFTRMVQNDLPEGVLGEVSYRMSAPLSEGRFTEAVEVGIYAFINAVAAKNGFDPVELEQRTVITADGSTQINGDATQPVLVSATDAPKSRPRIVNEAQRVAAEPVATPPAETPRAEPSPTETPTPLPSPIETPTPIPSPIETPTPEPSPAEAPTPEPAPSETPKPEVITETPKTETPKTAKTSRKQPVKATPAPKRLTPEQQAELDAD
ncbi:MAG TPA: TPM domain-containing protein, partial [Pyrinomonadaceae bacterium]|nr:TPM domain-containing protein [Pyrinomonadaceae bacterium]